MRRNRDAERKPVGRDMGEKIEGSPWSDWSELDWNEDSSYSDGPSSEGLEAVNRRYEGKIKEGDNDGGLNSYTPDEIEELRNRATSYHDDYEDGYWSWVEDEEELEPKVETSEFKIPANIIERYPVISELPQGVCIMGGMARSIAREVITGDVEPIRDIDLVNILDENGRSRISEEEREALSRKYMPDDYTYGHGIEDDKFDNYFRTRDFTINECLIQDGRLLVTDKAYNDLQENIVRITEYELDRDKPRGKLQMKALMLKVLLTTVTSSVPVLEGMDMHGVRDFDVALSLNKMMDRGPEMAMLFTKELVDWGIISQKYEGNPMNLARALKDRVGRFQFRPYSDEGDTGELERGLGGYFSEDTLNNYYTSDQAMRDIIEEYEGLTPYDYESVKFSDYICRERVGGRYTEGDYRWINQGGVLYN